MAATRLQRTWADKSAKHLRGESGVALSTNIHATGWFAAVRSGNLTDIQKFLDDTVIDVNYTDPEGHTGFFIACLESQVRCNSPARCLPVRGAARSTGCAARVTAPASLRCAGAGSPAALQVRRKLRGLRQVRDHGVLGGLPRRRHRGRAGAPVFVFLAASRPAA